MFLEYMYPCIHSTSCNVHVDVEVFFSWLLHILEAVTYICMCKFLSLEAVTCVFV